MSTTTDESSSANVEMKQEDSSRIDVAAAFILNNSNNNETPTPTPTCTDGDDQPETTADAAPTNGESSSGNKNDGNANHLHQKPTGDSSRKAVAEKDHSETKDAASTAVAIDRTWDHSHRRVIIDGVFRYDDAKTCRKMMEKWAADIKSKEGPGAALEVEKVRKPPKGHFVVVTVKEECMVQLLIDYINKNGIENKRGRKLIARLATDNDDDGDGDERNKRKHRDDDDGYTKAAADRSSNVSSKRQNIDQTAREARRPVTEDEIRDKVTPLWRLSPQEQLDSKQKDMAKRSAMKIVQEVKARFRMLEKEARRDGRAKTPIYDWISRKRCIEVDRVVAVPTPLRNKSEFNFGYRYLFESAEAEEKKNATMEQEEKTKEAVDTAAETTTASRKVPAVGFMATGWAGGVSKPHCCANIPPEVCAIVDLVDEFLLKSPLPPYDTKSHTGFWRTLTVRTSRRTAECMIVVMHAPVSGGIGDAPSTFSQHDVDQDKARLVSVLTQSTFAVPDIPDQAPLKVTSIFFQEFDGVSSPTPDHPVQHAYGNMYLQERVNKCTFQISPGAFFQVNTQGAEILYQLVVGKVREVSKDPSDTLLFDVCCGTGTIGLTCMKDGVVGRVVGIDISEPAIADAKRNANLNGFGDAEDDSSGTRFVAARAEHVMMKEIGRAKNTKTNKFVAVVDPARDGLHTDVIKALRGNERIERIVYVSCNPTGSLIKDAALLCAPSTKRYSGTAFRVESAIPVDMFPLTTHCELIMTFDRVKESDIKGGGGGRPGNSAPGKPQTPPQDDSKPASINEAQESPTAQDDSKLASTNEAQEKLGSMVVQPPSTQNEQPIFFSSVHQDNKGQHENEPSSRQPDEE
jgi:tRNA (uracil-5-)-methyltransferase